MKDNEMCVYIPYTPTLRWLVNFDDLTVTATSGPTNRIMFSTVKNMVGYLLDIKAEVIYRPKRANKT